MRFRELTTEATGISPATLSSYKKKASAEASALDKDAFEKGGPDAQAKLDKAHKRYKGINKATQKQFDNDAKGVTESGPFSYGAKKPRKGSVADLAAQKRKEQERGRKAIEPKDQMVGNAKVTTTTCPSCHSADVKTYSDGEKECNHCHKTWDVQGVAEGSIGQNIVQYKHGSIVSDKVGNKYKVLGYQGRALILQGTVDGKRVILFPHQLQQGVAEMDSHGYTGTRDKKSHSTYGNRDRDEVLTGPDVHLGPESLMTKKDVVKHGVSALRKAWDKALDTKPVSPQQQQRNKERWAKRQAEKNKPVQEGIDDELQQLTGNYRALMLGGGLDAAGKQKLRVVYDLLRDPIMQGDKEEYEKMHAYVSGKYPDLFDLLVGADDYVKGVDEASLATMRDYFAGDENAKDEMKITQMRKYYANDAAKEKTKKFNSLASYHHWLKQVGAEKINRK